MADLTYKDLVWVPNDFHDGCVANVRFPNSWEVEVIENRKHFRVFLNGVLPENCVYHYDVIYEGGTYNRDVNELAINLILRIVPCLPPYVPPTSFPEFDDV